MCHRCGFQIAIGLPWFHISKGGKWLHHRWWAMWFFMGFMGLLAYIHGLQKSYLLCIKGAASRLSLAFLDFTLARAGGGPSQSMLGHVVLHLFGLLAVTCFICYISQVCLPGCHWPSVISHWPSSTIDGGPCGLSLVSWASLLTVKWLVNHFFVVENFSSLVCKNVLGLLVIPDGTWCVSL